MSVNSGSFFLKSVLVWCLLLIFGTVPILVLKLWKVFVLICARLLRPKLKPFKSRDVMTIGDQIYRKPLINIGFVLTVNGNINIENFRKHFSQILLEPYDFVTEKRKNGNLLRFFKIFWGYPFKQNIKLVDIDLLDLIYESTLLPGESFSDFANLFFNSPFPEGKPLWNVALLQNVDPSSGNQRDGETAVLFRLHHSMGDGRSLIYLFEQLIDSSDWKLTSKPLTIFRTNTWSKLRLWFNAPLTLYDFGRKYSKRSNPLLMSGINTGKIYTFFTLDLDTVKRIRKRTGVHVTSILLTLLGSFVRTVLIEKNGSDDELPEYICMGHPLPWPGHPTDKMCNEWTVGMFKIPLNNPNALERLHETEKDFVQFHNLELNKIIKLVMLPLMALIPVGMLQKSADARTNMATSWSSIVAGNKYKLMGHEVFNIWPFVGFTNSRMAVVTSSVSHLNKIDVTLGINSEFLSEPSEVHRMVNEIFPKELQLLAALTEKLI